MVLSPLVLGVAFGFAIGTVGIWWLWWKLHRDPAYACFAIAGFLRACAVRCKRETLFVIDDEGFVHSLPVERLCQLFETQVAQWIVVERDHRSTDDGTGGASGDGTGSV